MKLNAPSAVSAAGVTSVNVAVFREVTDWAIPAEEATQYVEPTWLVGTLARAREGRIGNDTNTRPARTRRATLGFTAKSNSNNHACSYQLCCRIISQENFLGV
jgi:hypothetical protein